MYGFVLEKWGLVSLRQKTWAQSWWGSSCWAPITQSPNFPSGNKNSLVFRHGIGLINPTHKHLVRGVGKTEWVSISTCKSLRTMPAWHLIHIVQSVMLSPLHLMVRQIQPTADWKCWKNKCYILADVYYVVSPMMVASCHYSVYNTVYQLFMEHLDCTISNSDDLKCTGWCTHRLYGNTILSYIRD